MMGKRLFIVVPCYNEEEALPHSARVLVELIGEMAAQGRIDGESRVTFVDDGSRDRTWQVIERLAQEHRCVEGLKLARNRGHQNALWAGMMEVRERCDLLVSIDADLQDDPQAIRGFIDEFDKGAEVVYGVRQSRDIDTGFKRHTAQGYYRIMEMMGVPLVYNHADYRLLSRRALDTLAEFGEVNLFLRGMVPLLGFKSAQVSYDRGERVAGESKYPLRKMIMLAMEGITSFTVTPIRWIVALGALFALLSVLILLYALVSLAVGHTVPGWTSIMVSLWLIGGVQLIALGLIGEYVGKIYMESKRRPRYAVEEYLTKE